MPVLDLRRARYWLAEVPADETQQLDSLDAGFMPGIAWPEDTAWLFHTDIDGLSTYVGGSEHAVRDVLECPDLEAFRVEADDPSFP